MSIPTFDSLSTPDYFLFVLAFLLLISVSKAFSSVLGKLSIPLVLGYILAGICLGPFIFNAFTSDYVSSMLGLQTNFFVTGIVGQVCGMQLSMKTVKSIASRILACTGLTALFVVICVTIVFTFVCSAIPYFKEASLGLKILGGVLVGFIMTGRSPTVAVAVPMSKGAEGPYSKSLLGSTVLGDTSSIILFAALQGLSVSIFNGQSISPLLLAEVAVIILSTLALAALDFLILYLCIAFDGISATHAAKHSKALKVIDALLRCIGILIAGLVIYNISYFLTEWSADWKVKICPQALPACLIGSFLIRNFSSRSQEYINTIKHLTTFTFISFFGWTGVRLQLDGVPKVIVPAIAILLARMVGNFIGATSFLSYRRAKASEEDKKKKREFSTTHVMTGWMGFLAQAAASLTMAGNTSSAFEEWGDDILNLTMAVVVMNQICGPMLMQVAVSLSGEAVESLKNIEKQRKKKHDMTRAGSKAVSRSTSGAMTPMTPKPLDRQQKKKRTADLVDSLRRIPVDSASLLADRIEEVSSKTHGNVLVFGSPKHPTTLFFIERLLHHKWTVTLCRVNSDEKGPNIDSQRTTTSSRHAHASSLSRHQGPSMLTHKVLEHDIESSATQSTFDHHEHVKFEKEPDVHTTISERKDDPHASKLEKIFPEAKVGGNGGSATATTTFAEPPKLKRSQSTFQPTSNVSTVYEDASNTLPRGLPSFLSSRDISANSTARSMAGGTCPYVPVQLPPNAASSSVSSSASGTAASTITAFNTISHTHTRDHHHVRPPCELKCLKIRHPDELVVVNIESLSLTNMGPLFPEEDNATVISDSAIILHPDIVVSLLSSDVADYKALMYSRKLGARRLIAHVLDPSQLHRFLKLRALVTDPTAGLFHLVDEFRKEGNAGLHFAMEAALRLAHTKERKAKKRREQKRKERERKRLRLQKKGEKTTSASTTTVASSSTSSISGKGATMTLPLGSSVGGEYESSESEESSDIPLDPQALYNPEDFFVAPMIQDDDDDEEEENSGSFDDIPFDGSHHIEQHDIHDSLGVKPMDKMEYNLVMMEKEEARVRSAYSTVIHTACHSQNESEADDDIIEGVKADASYVSGSLIDDHTTVEVTQDNPLASHPQQPHLHSNTTLERLFHDQPNQGMAVITHEEESDGESDKIESARRPEKENHADAEKTEILQDGQQMIEMKDVRMDGSDLSPPTSESEYSH
ncbi:hypothetical protein ADUPG1_008747 [Aduncisulcus paluster]|uniref:Uncharacterized protein n=1 Tax=Aduncisulcus paluster TaxID=2918883 RepID=A0ABQ5KU97_9EUKA|nr:hypothetical protein ADUPG1_008747 [Aduncisulcus paluster]|eukprot:gnl/Carplike_NY0171/2488_a3346_637.p1 GENE.gnl/Carplike_NY0171/2488_a3346_637~~gnl/Carplike_NY0171/2488_a3346_637.p1  ORF type:complete len:1208 (+),score=373.57 gnl/Carplike_NY0171/2488_a3346_637:19-3642(+)